MAEPRLTPAARTMSQRFAQVPLRGFWRVAASVGPALVVVAIGAATLDAVARFRESRAWVAHSREVLRASQSVRSAIQDLEIGQRGFLLTGREDYLEPYRAGRRALASDTAALRRITRDDPVQQAGLDALDGIVRGKVVELDTTIALQRRGNAAGALALLQRGRGGALMDSARATLDSLDRRERRLLDARVAIEERHARVLLWVVIAGTALAGLLALGTNLLLARYAAQQLAVARTLADQNAHLEEQQQLLESQQAELEEQAAELEASNDELAASNEELHAQQREAQAARAEAEAANEAKSQFLATMSHELRTPLNAIQGYVQLLDMELHGPVTLEQREALARVDRAQRHLQGLINDVLNLARIESGTVEYDLRPVPLTELVTEVATLIEPQLALRGLAYEVAPVDPSIAVLADAEKARQVLLNLLSNAVKFTEPGGRVTLDAAAPAEAPDVVHLRVRDTGRGIPRDELERIFEPFVQLRRGLAVPMEGTGLGLAISRDLARGMHGDLWASSDDGAPGSLFIFALRRVVPGAEGLSGPRGGSPGRG